MRAARELVERAAHGSSEHTYGVNTGFGRFVNRAIPEDLTRELQLRLLRSHACGVGEPYDDEIVGRNPAEAFWLTYHFERSAEAQLKIQAAAAAGGKIVTPPREVREVSSRRLGPDGTRRVMGQREWPALLRMVEKLDPSYRN